ncbi:AraC family transcriptional regulator [Methylobacterium nodulans]|nr:AraC family transcriptional regulator [Methylobacterium nodulans]
MTMPGPMHRAEQFRSAVTGIEAVALASRRHFPRHAHDHFGIGVMRFGAHRSWSGIGPVEAGAGDVITVNPGEMHDGHPVDDRGRGWTMLYLDPGLMAREMRDETPGPFEITRPAVSDPGLADSLTRLFAGMIAPKPDLLALEERLLRTLMLLLRRYANRFPPVREASPPVARALRRLNEAPEIPVTLGELAALSGVSRFQLLRGFSREVGTTPHSYLIQRRVRLARQLLAAGQRPAEAAIAAGFADQSHMTRAFVRQFGVTPARYRSAVA